jgi:hypothetical protein
LRHLRRLSFASNVIFNRCIRHAKHSTASTERVFVKPTTSHANLATISIPSDPAVSHALQIWSG